MEMGDLQEFSPFHWVLEFAGVYADGGFDVLIGNPPWDRLKPLRDDYFSKYDEVFQRMPDNKDEKTRRAAGRRGDIQRMGRVPARDGDPGRILSTSQSILGCSCFCGLSSVSKRLY